MDTTIRTTLLAARRFLLVIVAGMAAAGASPAFAQCAGFADVVDDGPNGFCPTVEWMRNRNVTTGCGGGNYCPGQAVSRLSMAAFMKRLGDAMTPVRVVANASPGAVDLDANVVVCQTADLNVTGFPRTAYADGTLSGTAPADVSFAADLVFSTDGGTNWTAMNATPNRGSAPAAQWGSVSDIGSSELSVGQNVRFGTRLTRGGVAGATDLGDTRCQLRVLVYSRTGAASPY